VERVSRESADVVGGKKKNDPSRNFDPPGEKTTGDGQGPVGEKRPL